MLDPQDRQLLLDALRPPAGATFDCAIATTFTLDLPSLLVCPLALALRDAEDADGRPVLDPVALLDALRRVAGRITLFCQAGRISVPPPDKLLLSHLEGSVVEVQSPKPGHVFHPKLWALRFVLGEAVLYRLLVLSRNLTPDRAWDTLLTLEGPVKERSRAFAANHPLADLIDSLPGLAVHEPLPKAILARVSLVARELRRTEFEPPAGVDSIAFWPLGISGHKRWPFERGTRHRLVVSPFVGESTLERLTGDSKGLTLVSRLESLQWLPRSLLKGLETLVLSPGAVDYDPEDDAAGLAGLHAKVFVGDDGWESSVWVGSANATDAAFNGNVELLVELRGRKSLIGTEVLRQSLNSLLQGFSPGDPIPPDDAGESLQRMVDHARTALLDAGLVLQAAASGPGRYDLELQATKGVSVPEGIQVSSWPITVPGARLVDGRGEVLVRFTDIAPISITPFIAFEVAAEAGGRTLRERFVLNLPLLGDDATRREQIVRAVLHDPEQVLRLLMLLLSDPDDVTAVVGTLEAAEGGAGAWFGKGSTPLFEALMKALHEDPRRLDRVHGLITDLLAGGGDASPLPAGFLDIWEPVWRARTSMGV